MNSRLTFADIAHQSISFRENIPHERMIVQLLDTPWVQRLRDISQTANTRLVYMFSEHSRFGHSLGVAHLACMVMEILSSEHAEEIAPFREAVAGAALLHDIGHLAPGSHTAFKTWFPSIDDCHEQISKRILKEDKVIREILGSHADSVAKILSEDGSLPPWTWQTISGGGWNVDRGNWCIIDSVLAGVNYGQYNIPALIESIVLTQDKQLALRENRLDAMMHFAISRQAMYRQVYQHRVILAIDTINRAIAKRARDTASDLPFSDETMRLVLRSDSPMQLPLEAISSMRESWWRYHILRWRDSRDRILSDLCDRLLNRRLFKTVRVSEDDSFPQLEDAARLAVERAGFDPRYYLHTVSTSDINEGESRQSMLVQMDDGRALTLGQSEPLFSTMVRESSQSAKTWIVMPAEAKELLGRAR